MRYLPLLAIFIVWFCYPSNPSYISPQPVYYFEQQTTVAKPAAHDAAWFDGEGWRGADAR